MRRSLLPALLLLVLPGCRQEPAADRQPETPLLLAGQVFTIRNDGVNLPLGGVEVSWVPAGKLQRELGRIRERSPRIEALLAYESTLRDARDALQRIRDDRRAGELFDRFATQADWLIQSNRSAFENHEDIELLLEAPRFARSHGHLFAGSGFERDVQSHWMLVHLFVSRLGSIRQASTTTDAEGGFGLQLPSPADGFLVADAQTSALGATHHDYWIVPAGTASRDDLVLSPRLRLGPQGFRTMREAADAAIDEDSPRLDVLYGLADLGPLIEAMARHEEVTRNLDQKEHLEQRIEVLRQELSETLPPAAN